MVKYILMLEAAIQKIRKGDKFFVNGECNPNGYGEICQQV